ncbi:MAG: DUF3450 family protein [Opitutales bacterium]
MKPAFSIGLAAAMLASPFFIHPLQAEDKIGAARGVLEQWVETNRIISEEKSDWRFEQSVLEDTRAMLENELGRLEETLQELEQSISATEKEREQQNDEKARLSEGAAVVAERIAGFEDRLKKIARAFPEPFRQEIKPMLRRIPEDPDATEADLGGRVRNILAILAQAEKFNSSFTRTSESHESEDGTLVEVRTLYWGLAMAYYVDASGTRAGIGHPGKDGWEWSEVEGAGPAIERLLEVSEGDGAIEFIEVPARIHDVSVEE